MKHIRHECYGVIFNPYIDVSKSVAVKLAEGTYVKANYIGTHKPQSWITSVLKW